MSRTLVGYFIRRTWKKPPHIGKTLCSTLHRIYPTKKSAVDALILGERSGHFDDRFDHDVEEVWMHTEEE